MKFQNIITVDGHVFKSLLYSGSFAKRDAIADANKVSMPGFGVTVKTLPIVSTITPLFQLTKDNIESYIKNYDVTNNNIIVQHFYDDTDAESKFSILVSRSSFTSESCVAFMEYDSSEISTNTSGDTFSQAMHNMLERIKKFIFEKSDNYPYATTYYSFTNYKEAVEFIQGGLD